MKYLVKIFGLCFLIPGVVILIHSYTTWSHKNKLLSEGGRVIATVIGEHKERSDPGGIPTYNYVFEYYVDSVKYHVSTEFDSTNKLYVKGESHYIAYDINNPEDATILSKNESVNLKLMQILLFSSFIVVGLIVLLVDYKKVAQIFKNN